MNAFLIFLPLRLFDINLISIRKSQINLHDTFLSTENSSFNYFSSCTVNNIKEGASNQISFTSQECNKSLHTQSDSRRVRLNYSENIFFGNSLETHDGIINLLTHQNTTTKCLDLSFYLVILLLLHLGICLII